MSATLPRLRQLHPGWYAGAGALLWGAGWLTGVTTEPWVVGRLRLRPDPERREPLGRLPGRGHLVAADDGIRLQVAESGDPDSDLTVIFVHGYTLELACWHYQRRDLAEDARLVLYDQRGHGRSDRGSPETATIDQLGRDLHAVLQSEAPDGPVVLVGHSMGGMTIMALAAQHPELFGPRVVGVALLNTSPGRLAELTFGLPAVLAAGWQRVASTAVTEAKRRAQLLEHGRALTSEFAFLLTRRYSFGSRSVSPALVDFVERMTLATPIDVITDFYPTFVDHDKLAALDSMRGIEVLVLGSDNDLITPPEHSRGIARALPAASLVIVPRAGHLAMLEQHDEVTRHLRGLLLRVRRQLAVAPDPSRVTPDPAW